MCSCLQIFISIRAAVFWNNVRFLGGNTNEQTSAVLKPGGNKGVAEFLSISKRHKRAELGNVLEMDETGFVQMFNVNTKSQMWAALYSKIGYESVMS